MAELTEEAALALAGSIQKWERIVAGTDRDRGSANCPLCDHFIDGDCVRCPVFEATGGQYCVASPFHQWDLHHLREHGGPKIVHEGCAECARLAAAELAFLRSLQPKEGEKMITLRKTCGACPEQYDAFDEAGNQVGYLRLRHGRFRVDCPNCGGQTVYEASPEGDGCFDEEERDYYLRFAVRAILDWIDRRGIEKRPPAPNVQYRVAGD